MSIIDGTRRILASAQMLYGDSDQAADLARMDRRLSEPLRVAIAGKVKAGKSTLLNALVGDLLAPTDEGECTQIVTWYQDGLSPLSSTVEISEPEAAAPPGTPTLIISF